MLPFVLFLLTLWFPYKSYGLYTPSDNIKLLSSSNFQQYISRSGLTIIEFFAPWCGHCKALVPEYKRIGNALKGIIRVAAIDGDQYKDISGKYQIQGFPTIKIFSSDEPTKPIDYQGPRDAKSIIKFLLKQTRTLIKNRLDGKSSPLKNDSSKSKSNSKNNQKNEKNQNENTANSVIELNDQNFNEQVMNSNSLWMVEFYAPWCGHCKKLAPEWSKAADELNGSNVKLGAVDATVHKKLAEIYQIQGFPTIKIFRPKSTSSNDAIEYQGPREANGIIQYALEQAEKYGAGISLIEITSQEILEEHCNNDNQMNLICIIAFLPHLSESGKTRRMNYLRTLEDTMKSKRHGGQLFRYGWIQAMDQMNYENFFSLTYGFPTVLALNMKKQRYVLMKGSLTKIGLMEFTKGIMSGKEKTTPYDNLPLLKTVEPWNGEDYVEEQTEDDKEAEELIKKILKEQGVANDEL